MAEFEAVPVTAALAFAGVTKSAWHNLLFREFYPAKPATGHGKMTWFDRDDMIALCCLGEMIRLGWTARLAGSAASQVRVYLSRRNDAAEQLWLLQRDDGKPPRVTEKQPGSGGITVMVDVAGLRRRLERGARPARQRHPRHEANGAEQHA